MRNSQKTGVTLIAGIIAGIAVMGCLAAADGGTVPDAPEPVTVSAEVTPEPTTAPVEVETPAPVEVAAPEPIAPADVVTPEPAPAPPIAPVAPVEPASPEPAAPAPVAPDRVLTACLVEDSDNCYWDARTMGNGTGTSFITLDGVTYYPSK